MTTSDASLAPPTKTSTNYYGSAPAIPEPTQPGTVATCRQFHLHDTDDVACDGLVKTYGTLLSDFHTWNPRVGDNARLNSCVTMFVWAYSDNLTVGQFARKISGGLVGRNQYRGVASGSVQELAL